ncbi:hypothetical protein JXJ21_14265 [candidate division KSB1 bacterium]|nr:hypothetical protein [candidate division KSB1 bacterium]
MLNRIIIMYACIHFLAVAQTGAQSLDGRTILNFRGGFWRLKNDNNHYFFDATVESDYIHSDFNYSFGSGIDLYYWYSDGLALGMTVGALSQGEGDDQIEKRYRMSHHDSHLDFDGYHRNVTIIPFVIGARVSVLAPVRSPIKPYVSAGGGLYWGIDTIQEGNFGDHYEAEVGSRLTSASELTTGGYLGAGADFIIWRRGLMEFKCIRESDIGRSWFGNILGIGFGLNVDYRYHFINFEESVWDRTHYSGSEITFGFNLIFGKEKPVNDNQKKW